MSAANPTNPADALAGVSPTAPTSPRTPFAATQTPLAVRRRVANLAAVALTAVFASAAVLFLLYLIAYVAQQGLRYINWDFFTQVPPADGESGGGLGPALEGSGIMLALASALGIPLGLGVGVYLSEVGRGAVAYMVRFLVDVLTGIPTIIFGLFIWVLVVVPSHSFSGFAGGMALAIIMIPTIARATEEVLRLVPKSLREASAALGGSESRTILSVVIPAARSGIITGILLALARVAGETAPLIMTAFGSTFFPTSLFRPMDSLPSRVFNFTLSPYPVQQGQATAGAFVLMMLVILTSLGVRLATGGFRRTAR